MDGEHFPSNRLQQRINFISLSWDFLAHVCHGNFTDFPLHCYSLLHMAKGHTKASNSTSPIRHLPICEPCFYISFSAIELVHHKFVSNSRGFLGFREQHKYSTVKEGRNRAAFFHKEFQVYPRQHANISSAKV